MRARALVLVSAVVAAAVVAAALAGCLAQPQSGSGPPAERSELERSYDLRLEPTNASEQAGRADWFVIQTEAAPGGAITAYAWTVPRGAVGLEVVPLLTDSTRDKVTSWGFLKFRMDDSRAVLAGGHLSPTVSTVNRTGALSQETQTRDPSVEPFWIPLAASGGEQIALVVAAETSDRAPFGLAMRPLSFADVSDASPVPDADAFFGNVDRGAGLSLDPTGTGSGFAIPAYVERNALGSGGFAVRSSSIQVREDRPDALDPRPAATVRDTTLVTDFQVESGWGLAIDWYDNEDGGGTWSVDARVHDHRVQREGPTVTPVTPGKETEEALGRPFFMVTGEGQEPSHVEFGVRTVNANVHEELALLQVELGGTLEDLVGGEGLALTMTDDGDVDDVGPSKARVVDGGLLVPLPGGDVTFQGLAPRG